ncbi:hypothetical protein [Chromohalobacter israelensis]|uniref:hypothetical protein n=1 Tax=Chromohalobacter israelensis TaxID=141390 RepID=UPI00265C07CA|nr:hypothetical protein [Chromohalobacter salexigens]MDO0946643.1 hypothetical protein [Chromohalobacter salexigens]
MTNHELQEKRRALDAKAERIAGLPAFAAAGEMKAAGLLAAEITSELARRELQRETASHE